MWEMDDPMVVVPVKKEMADIKAEAECTEAVEETIDCTSMGTTEVHTVVLQNIQIHEGGEDLPIILNDFPQNNSDGNLQIATLEEDVIHTYIIE
ncbi:hypothetical protein NQ314_013322 [Rhamnusium bicolor]|uniref:Uncharacterized protein n=1 Tax=Rhamnusium bicolor TaxID=1586634 RepID=A0AAV8X7K9_9CUCU|nr:hypothetical protein NQ314_013322 [Rhamnusium bicolor]